MINFPYKHVHLVGIKGVAMTSLAQLLHDYGVAVTGSDVAEDFVTKAALEKLHPQLQTSFTNPIPAKTDCVIFTAAHGAKNNPQVRAAIESKIKVLSHAKALSIFFNPQKGIAVCGVGGKSTTSAMIAWILEKLDEHPSYAVGVGNIIGMAQTGKYASAGKIFVAEADEYVVDPNESSRESRVARFSYLKPKITVCTNILHDHPDVYKDKNDTFAVFNSFFSQMDAPKILIINSESAKVVTAKINTIITYGPKTSDNFQVLPNIMVKNRSATTQLIYDGKSYSLKLKIPGFFNMLNAAAALAACVSLGLPITDCLQSLASFSSTQRRFEDKGIINGVRYYDDYAHHPSELAATITAAKKWEANKRIVFAFQPHTYSRTKKLLREFSSALALADEILILPIYASAREKFDDSITSKKLKDAIQKRKNLKKLSLIPSIEKLASWCKDNLKTNDVLITLGAGDIYKLYDLLE